MKFKRGQARELVTFGVMAIILGIVIIIGFKLVTDINDNFQGSDVISDQGKAGLDNFQSKFAVIFDSVYIMAIVLLSIIMVASVFVIDTHPLFFAVSIPLFLATLFVNAILANVLDEVGRTGALLTLYNQLPMMQFAAQNWLIIVSTVGIVALVALYGKRSGLV